MAEDAAHLTVLLCLIDWLADRQRHYDADKMNENVKQPKHQLTCIGGYDVQGA